MFNNNKYPRTLLLSAAVGVACMGLSLHASADQYSEAAEKWVNEAFKNSTLSREEQLKEMEWFIKAAEQFRGMDINVVSETIATHEYESNVLAKAFSEITGINLTHTLIQEGDVIEKLQTQMQSGRNIYDGYVNDSDLIGTHFRYGKVVAVEDIMNGSGKDLTLPTLDLDDFIGLDFTTGPDGKLYQLPSQQFANLYWFRADWFEREDLQEQFKEIYGYDLGVPVNWSAYEDIAEFFSVHVKEIDGERVYGHMDYGKKDPSLGWRFTDAWFSMAGAGDKGLPNGLPVDEWGIRVEECHPVGSSVSRGGATNGPAAVYATTKYVDWLREYAPPEAQGMTFSEAGPVPAQGNVAQQIFWYTAFTVAIPLLIPWNVVGTIWQIFARGDIGLFGWGINQLGFDYNYTGDTLDAWLTVLLMDVWHWTPLVALLCYSGLRAIPEAFYQAAEIDRASKWAVFRYIQLPRLKSVLIIAVLLRFMDSFMIYIEPFVLTGGGPGSSTTFLSQTLTTMAIGQFDLGRAAAFSLIYFLIVLLISWLFFTAITHADKEK